MSEYCLDCVNRIWKSHLIERDFILSRDLDLCEGCGEYKHVIVRLRWNKILYDLIIWIKKKCTQSA